MNTTEVHVWQIQPNEDASLQARERIMNIAHEEFGISSFIPETDTAGIPVYTDLYWSIAHKERWVAIAVALEPIGIDIELLKSRNELLWQYVSTIEWNIIGEKSWENFYKIWTAKEALIKKLLLTLDDAENMTLVNIENNVLILDYKGNQHYVAIAVDREKVWAHTL